MEPNNTGPEGGDPAAGPATAAAEAVICSICLGVATQPQLTACNHRFCEPCLSSWLRTQQASERSAGTCPLCRSTLTQFQPQPPRESLERLRAMLVTVQEDFRPPRESLLRLRAILVAVQEDIRSIRAQHVE